LKYKAKYLELKAKVKGGLITEAVRPMIISDKEKDSFRTNYFNKPNYYIAYKTDNTHILEPIFQDKSDSKKSVDKIFNVRVCKEKCENFNSGQYEIKSITATNIISCNSEYVIIESDEWAELQEPVKPQISINHIPNGYYNRLHGIVLQELLDEIKSYVDLEYNNTEGPIGFGGKREYHLPHIMLILKMVILKILKLIKKMQYG